MTGSRFDWRKPLTVDRLKDFVAVDNITAQVPLIEVPKDVLVPVRIWVAYDYTRTQGTFLEVWIDGMVKTVTIYPSGKRHEIINRPPNIAKGVHRAKKPRAVSRKPRRTKAIPKGTQAAMSKE